MQRAPGSADGLAWACASRRRSRFAWPCELREDGVARDGRAVCRAAVLSIAGMGRNPTRT